MQELNTTELPQSWPLPSKPKPIVLIGAGGIVNDAHLPAYQKAGFEVAGIYDIEPERSRATAERFGIESVYASIEEALATEGVVFDRIRFFGSLQPGRPRLLLLRRRYRKIERGAFFRLTFRPNPASVTPDN